MVDAEEAVMPAIGACEDVELSVPEVVETCSTAVGTEAVARMVVVGV